MSATNAMPDVEEEVQRDDSIDEGWIDRRYSGELIHDCEAVQRIYGEGVCTHF